MIGLLTLDLCWDKDGSNNKQVSVMDVVRPFRCFSVCIETNILASNKKSQ